LISFMYPMLLDDLLTSFFTLSFRPRFDHRFHLEAFEQVGLLAFID